MKFKWSIKNIKNFHIYLENKPIFLPVLILLLIPLIYSLYRVSNLNYWDGTMGNWLATILGVIGGIPIALEVNKWMSQEEEKREKNLNKKKEINILLLIKEELDFSYNSLFLKGKKGNKTTMVIQPLKSDLWDAFVAGEELKYIEDPNLLNRIASAYYILKLVKDIEKQAYIALRTSAIIFTNDKGVKQNAAQLLLQDARSFDTLFEYSIKKASKMIYKRLKELKKYEK